MIKRNIWFLLPFLIRSFILKTFYIKKGFQKIPQNSSIDAYQVKGVVDDIKDNKVYKKRTGYSKEGIYEHAFLLKYFEIVKKSKYVIDIGSGPGTQIKSLVKLFDINNEKFNYQFGENFLCFEPSIKYSDIFKLNLNFFPIREFVTSGNSKYSIKKIISQSHNDDLVIKIDIEGYEYFLLEDICKIKFNNCHFLVEFHINKIKQMKLDPHKILNEIEKLTEINYNLHHDSLRNTGEVDFDWKKTKPNLDKLDTIAIYFKL